MDVAMKALLMVAVILGVVWAYCEVSQMIYRSVKALRLKNLRAGRVSKKEFYEEWVDRGYRSEKEFIDNCKERC